MLFQIEYGWSIIQESSTTILHTDITTYDTLLIWLSDLPSEDQYNECNDSTIYNKSMQKLIYKTNLASDDALQ